MRKRQRRLAIGYRLMIIADEPKASQKLPIRQFRLNGKGTTMLQISLREPAALLILLVSGTMLLGQNPKPSPSESPKPNPAAKDEKPSEPEPPPPVVTEHSLTLPDGKSLRYKAITGYLMLRDTVEEQNKAQEEQAEESEDSEPEATAEPKKNEKPVDPAKGKQKAQVFCVAYV